MLLPLFYRLGRTIIACSMLSPQKGVSSSSIGVPPNSSLDFFLSSANSKLSTINCALFFVVFIVELSTGDSAKNDGATFSCGSTIPKSSRSLARSSVGIGNFSLNWSRASITVPYSKSSKKLVFCKRRCAISGTSSTENFRRRKDAQSEFSLQPNIVARIFRKQNRQCSRRF